MKKSGFLTFILSFIPGCGLMYLGYMKKGLQTMLMFAGSIFLAALSSELYHYFEWIMVFFISLLPIIWLYQLFDSMHTIARMKRLEIEVPTDDGFVIPEKLLVFSPSQNSTVAKVIAVVLIVAGSFGLVFGILDNLHPFIDASLAQNIINAVRGYIVPVIFSLALIIAGVKLLKGSKSKAQDKRKG